GLLELPTDRPRQKVAGARGARVPFELPRAVFEKIAAFGRAERATPFMVLFAALSLLFHRYSGQRAFVGGTPIANRQRREFEDLIGLFVTLAVLHADLEGDPTVRELLERTRRTALDAYANGGADGAPLFQTAFALETTALDLPAWEGLETAPFELYSQAAKYDLAFMLNQGETISGWIEYNPDLFDRTTILRMGEQFRSLLEWMVESGGRRISEARMLSAAESQQLAVEWNDTLVEHDARSYVARIEEQARLRPDAPAVSDERGSVTFRELNQRANRLARRLVREGVGPEITVAVVVDRGVELVIAWLAVGKAGGAYLAVGEGVPRARWEAKAPLIVSQRHRAEGYAGRVVWMDEESGWSENLGIPVAGENLAYVIFTSGSTGKPKGVAVEHRGLSNLIDWHVRVHEVHAGDRASQVANSGFDAAGWEIWPYLAVGASVTFAGDAQRQSPAELVEWLRRERVTFCFLPTLLAEAALAEDFSQTRLRVLFTGGDRLRQRPPATLGCPLWNLYGPTETTVVSTWGQVSGEGAWAPDIGGPFANTRAYVLDERGALAPIGVIGELYLGGVGLARGYLGQAAETAERFVPDAVSGEPGRRLYRTGDLVKWGRDGRLVCVGRSDEQVKLRGYRIELGEVETQLAQLEGVRAAAVVLKGEGERRRLAAYVVGDGLDAEELRARLRERLPDYMAPGVISVLDELPVTTNGKINRAALAKLEDTAGSSAQLRGPIEEAIADFWLELLGRRPAPDDRFFELGGHSLLASRLAARIRNTFQIEFPLAIVFEKPTVSLLASEVETALSGGG
ncbi:MAG TPA: amino acid adenylation domain-containing protein, partial [Bryobacteraceae bacterium]